MKRLVYLLIAVSLMLALVPAVASADEITVDLLAGQTEDIGDVKVWNDAEKLYVQFLYTGPDCGFLEVHLQVDKEGAWSEDILTKKGNPIPGQFEMSHKPGGCFTEHTFEYDLVGEGFDCDGTLWIAAHAALGREEAMTFESNVGDIVYGPISSNDMPTDWGTTGSAVQAYNWLGYTRNLGDPDQIPGCTTNPYSSPSWSWGFGLNPTYSPDIPGVPWISTAPNTEQWDVDSWRKFVENYEVPGYSIAGSLQVNADNYYVVSNGEVIGSDDNIFNGPETYAFYPMEGTNTLEFVTENWAQGSPTNYCDQLANPNGVTYKGTVSYYADGETAWGCGNDSAEPNCHDFDGKNWATYFEYAVQCCTNVPEVVNGSFESPVVTATQGWDIYDSGYAGLGWTVEWRADVPTSWGGWTRPDPAHLELHRGVNNWLPSDGYQYTELDTDWNDHVGSLNNEPASVKIYQDLLTCPVETYVLTYAWSPRPGHGDNSMEVYWDGNLIATHSGSGGSNTNWTVETHSVTASVYTTRLEFVETGTNDSLGMFLDDVGVEISTP
jgi:hypothetical protein